MNRLNRRKIVKQILDNRRDMFVISGLGSPSYDVMAAGDNDQNFYLWGAMGAAALVGLGLALSQPEKTIAVITGDGEQLMGMGGFATIGVAAPKNLVLIVLNNEHYGETGMQRSHTGRGVDLVAVASACGFEHSQRISEHQDIDALCLQMHQHSGTRYVEIMISMDEQERCLPPRDGVFLKNRIRKALGYLTI